MDKGPGARKDTCENRGAAEEKLPGKREDGPYLFTGHGPATEKNDEGTFAA